MSSFLRLLVLASIAGILLAPSTATAHSVNVFAYVNGEEVITESYFHDGKKCQDSTIEVFDNEGNKLAEGKTDTEGRFSFRPSIAADLTIRLTTPMGHRAEYAIPATDLQAGLPGTTKVVEGIAEEPHEHAHLEAAEMAPRDAEAEEAHSQTNIERIVDEAVARRLAPIHRALEESRRQRKIVDIIGGIGYIVGLMGLIMYFKSRQKREQ
jgi:nickel transport protein